MKMGFAERLNDSNDKRYFLIIIKTNSNEFNYFLGMDEKNSPSAGVMNLDPPSS